MLFGFDSVVLSPECADLYHEKALEAAEKLRQSRFTLNDYLDQNTEYGWYLCMNGDQIIAGMGVIENDFQDRKVIKNRIARLEIMLDEAQKELDEMQELRYEPEYYESYQKMDELEEKISLKEKEIESLMEEWEQKMEAME